MQKVARTWGLAALVAAALLAGFAAPALQVHLASTDLHLDGDDLRVSVPPQFQFLTGKPLEKLKDGATLVYLAQLSLSGSSDTTAPLHHPAVNRFLVSYDVFEYNFSVTSLGVEHATASHLSAAAAQSWCLDHLPLGIDGVPRDKPLWIKLELLAEDTRDQTGVLGDSGINLTRLIEALSNRARAQQMHWEAVAGPIRLDGLKREHRSLRSG